MAVGSGTPYNAHTGNGVTTTFAYGFTLLDADDLVVTIDGVATSAYTVTGLGVAAGGTVVFSTAPASGAKIILQRVIQLVRATDYQDDGDLLADTLNADFNRLWMAIQGVSAGDARSIRAPFPEVLNDLPSAADRADKILTFNSAGQPILTTPVAGTAGALAADLASTASATKGAGMIWFNYARNYAAYTVGAKLRESISVLDFGAVADGNAATGAGTDNLAAFQAALAYAVANRLSVYVPAGVYILSARLQVPTNVRLYGAGMYCTILIAKSTFTDGLGLIHCNGIGGPPTIVEHMAILGQTSTGAGAGSCGINAAANAVVLQHLWIGGFTNPFQFSGTDGRGFDLWADVPLASGYGFVISNGGNTLIDIVTFNSYTGIYIDSTGYWSTSEPDIGVTIDGADIIQSGYSGVTMVNALNTTLNNIRIHSPTAAGKFTRDMITVTDGANITLSNIQGNFGTSVSTTCVGIRQTGTTQNLKVQGCSIVGADFGYLFNNIPFGQVQGNSARNCRTWGFRVLGDSAGLAMQGNQSQFNGTSSATDGGGYWLSNSSGSGKWNITGNSAGDFGSTSKYGFYIDANASTAAKISLGLNAVTNTATAYTIVGTPSNVTQTANI